MATGPHGYRFAGERVAEGHPESVVDQDVAELQGISLEVAGELGIERST